MMPVAEAFIHAVSADFSEIEQLHRLRIQAKRLRYSFDALAGAFSVEKADSLTAQFRELQDDLGAINDRAEAQRILRECEATCRSAEVAAVVLYLTQYKC